MKSPAIFIFMYLSNFIEIFSISRGGKGWGPQAVPERFESRPRLDCRMRRLPPDEKYATPFHDAARVIIYTLRRAGRTRKCGEMRL